jgi:hypothetical protein
MFCSREGHSLYRTPSGLPAAGWPPTAYSLCPFIHTVQGLDGEGANLLRAHQSPGTLELILLNFQKACEVGDEQPEVQRAPEF